MDVRVQEKNLEFSWFLHRPIVHGFPLGECEGTGFVPGFSVLDVDLGMIWVTRPGFRWFGCSFGRRGRGWRRIHKSTQSKSNKINPDIQSAPEKSSQLSNPRPRKDSQLNFPHKFLRKPVKLWMELIEHFSPEVTHPFGESTGVEKMRIHKYVQ